MKINVVTLCSGYDAQCLALERLKHNYSDFDYELVAWAEVDKYAIQAHNALFPQWKDRNMGDITSCDWSKIKDNIDLLTYSTPCQSISSAGKQDGLKKGSGTASSIIWSVLNAIDVLRPKYLLMENVKALVSSKFIGDFHEWRSELSKRGYSNFAKVLNSKCYSIPQNRERIFMVSILDENASYHFPEPFPLNKRLKDVLEEDVDEKYYLSKKLVDYVFSNGGKEGNIQGGIGVHDKNDEVANTITAQYWKSPRQGNYLKEPIACAMRGREVQCLTTKRTEYGKKVRKEYESGELKESRHNMQQLEPRTDGVCNTITSVQKDCLIIEPFNVCDDGTARTIKAQYYKNGMANFKRTDGLGATGVKVIGNIYDNNVQSGRIYSTKGISPTIDTAMGGNREPKILSYTRDANGQVVIHGGTGGGGNTDSYVVETGYRIRKLTERECFRLMDVDDADIDKIQAAGISKSQQYKMAGNSICTGVLFHIFRKLFVDKENENQQLTLF